MYTRNCEIKPGIEFPAQMHRVALGLEYCGTAFSGFQKQASTENTVQAHLERAFSEVAQEEISLVCAGRTDAGVHASAQVVHFDTLAQRPNKAWVHGSNTKLPDDIRVRWACAQSERFHARFSAKSRTYRYLLRSANTRSAILGRCVTHIPFSLDIDKMEHASKILVGEHDFSAFRSSQCQAHHAQRCIDYIRWAHTGELEVIEIQANAFLHHMVRNIVGSLLEIGRGAKDAAWLADVLAQRDRRLAGPTASASGLYLVAVDYDDDFALPKLCKGPLFLPD